jgi:hypothetical protein
MDMLFPGKLFKLCLKTQWIEEGWRL